MLSSFFRYAGIIRLEVRRGSEVRSSGFPKKIFCLTLLCYMPAICLFKSVSSLVKSLIQSGASRIIM